MTEKDRIDHLLNNLLKLASGNFNISDFKEVKNDSIGAIDRGIFMLGEQLEANKISDVNKSRKNGIELTNALILGEETERKRIASNLHDGLGQYLSGLRMHLQVLKGDIDDQHYNKLVFLIDTAIKEYRSVSHDLIPPNLKMDGLEEAIRLACNKLNSKLIKINFKSNLKHTKIPEGIEMELYRITQELINNSLKHANAKKIEIKLTINKQNVLSIEFEDDGDGFDVEKTLNKLETGIGLKNILSRIHFLKGTIKINSKLGKGTHININIML
jgi:two-component system NarL family sensor kinase